MKQSATNTLDFAVTEQQQSALESSEHRAARVDLEGLAFDNAFRPWNSHFEDPTTPLDLPKT
jgi:hypothetical protein